MAKLSLSSFSVLNRISSWKNCIDEPDDSWDLGARDYRFSYFVSCPAFFRDPNTQDQVGINNRVLTTDKTLRILIYHIDITISSSCKYLSMLMLPCSCYRRIHEWLMSLPRYILVASLSYFLHFVLKYKIVSFNNK